MCGFVALVSLTGSPVESCVLERMLSTIQHRGPDDSGLALLGSFGLGFRRLSILDLTPSGHQPMQSCDQRYTIVFNGEIYNYLELRSELQSLGHQFQSSGDSEVLLAAYRQWGEGCLQRLNGMWAFVIHDAVTQTLFGSRDRFGIKPLYRYQDSSCVLFASEIKALRASGLYKDRLNPRVCATYLHEGRLDESEETFFEGITQLPAGFAFRLTDRGVYEQWSFWSMEGIAAQHMADPAQAFAQSFEDAMRLHMRSDVPIAVNLSGGLDSTAIICAAARQNAAAGSAAPLMAFSYMDARFDERRYIQDTLALTGAQVVPLKLSPRQLWDSLPSMLAFQDEPVHTMTALIGFHLMGLAQQHGVKVVLNGQGADETIAGYGSYFHDYWYELARAGRFGRVWQQIGAFAQGHGVAASGLLLRTFKHVVQTSLRAWPAYRAAALRRRRASQAKTDWLAPELAAYLPDTDEPYGMALQDTLNRSVKRSPLPLYLRIEDRNSMAHSVEARVPFLDYRLVSLLCSMPSQYKLDGPWNKHVMRQGLEGKIPESVRTRVDKMGFPTSASDWFKAELREPLQDLVASQALREHEWLRAPALQRRLQAHLQGQGNHAGPLFAAAQFLIWQQGLASGKQSVQ
ncbi:MAG: asparagine synthase (glutamine-hydrolyzing) [Burkholderiales bacterium]|nr:asparagine synthase (glutamine-hydrolyzing) [Burkholderiales bacterium]